jgi:hypothetical protein
MIENKFLAQLQEESILDGGHYRSRALYISRSALRRIRRVKRISE